MEERLYELVQQWRTDYDALEMLDPEDYQRARARNGCADDLEALLAIPEHEFNEPPGQPLPEGIQELRERPVDVSKHPSVDEIMALLNRDDLRVQILPNGEVTAVAGPKVITMREALGGEY